MPSTTATETELPELATAVAEASPEPDDIEYPEGNWIAQSVWHGDAVRLAATALAHHFRERSDVLVAMEVRLYYQRGNNKVWLQPDVQVVFGVNRGNRTSYRIWEEGKPPDFVLEVASPSTADRDAREKAREYAEIGVREYWRLDPLGELMRTPLEGYVASEERYGPLEPVASTDGSGRLQSEVLGLELRSRRHDGATVLVFRDPRTGEEFDGAPEEAERRRRIAERDARSARQEASAAQQRASVAEHEASVAKQRASAAEQEAGVAKQRASAAEQELRAEKVLTSAANERVRELEERIRALTAPTAPPERDG